MDQPYQRPPFFYEIFDPSLPRLGPGDNASTMRALDTLLSVRKETTDSPALRILDIGCGNGTPTIQLAKHPMGTIVAVDNHQPFLDELRRRAEAEGVSERIRPCLGDMRALEMKEAAFDLIWSEGALSIMGFREGLTAWYPLLAPGGLMAVSDLTWFTDDAPAECQEYWSSQCPMFRAEENLAIIRECGYAVIGHFALPTSAWWDEYYLPLEERLRLLRPQHAADPDKLELIESIQLEIEIHRKYSDYYGYTFYLMQRR